MKRKRDKNFSCTLDGYLEAKEYLQRKGLVMGLAKLNGIELVEEANKEIRKEQSTANLFNFVRSYSVNAIRFLRRKIAYRIHAIGGIICLNLL